MTGRIGHGSAVLPGCCCGALPLPVVDGVADALNSRRTAFREPRDSVAACNAARVPGGGRCRRVCWG
eukprot:12601773-Prorocentrum_lima.AAC.1